MCTCVCLHSVDHCYGIWDCSGHGVCAEIELNGPTNGVRGFECTCEQGWHGQLCDMQRCVGDVVCMNGGECSYDGCDCAEGWGGETCEVLLDPECTAAYNVDCGHGYCIFENGQRKTAILL